MNQLTLRGSIKNIVRYNDTKSIFMLAVKRLSGVVDVLPAKVDTHKLEGIKPGNFVTINGKINSQNITINGKQRVSVFCYAEKIKRLKVKSYFNQFVANGTLCKIKPLYHAGHNRILTECILSIRRQDNKIDYIPLVFWEKDAITVSELPIGTNVQISGRFQSRGYKTKDGDAEIVREVSVNNLEIEKGI